MQPAPPNLATGLALVAVGCGLWTLAQALAPEEQRAPDERACDSPVEVIAGGEARVGCAGEELLAACWLWTGAKTPKNYGYFTLCTDGGTYSCYTHRLSFMTWRGELPADKPHVLHKCDVRNCVNPDHLYAGTQKDNTRDMMDKRRHWSFQHVSDEKIAELIALYQSPEWPGVDVAIRRFGWADDTVRNIIRGEHPRQPVNYTDGGYIRKPKNYLSPLAKLRPSDVRYIRSTFDPVSRKYRYPIKYLAELFGVHESGISRIARRLRFAEIED